METFEKEYTDSLRYEIECEDLVTKCKSELQALVKKHKEARDKRASFFKARVMTVKEKRISIPFTGDSKGVTDSRWIAKNFHGTMVMPRVIYCNCPLCNAIDNGKCTKNECEKCCETKPLGDLIWAHQSNPDSVCYHLCRKCHDEAVELWVGNGSSWGAAECKPKDHVWS